VSPERILIVGGGIAGLALGTALRRAGLEPEIVERAPAFGAVGAGIALGVNAMAMMRRLGLEEATLERGFVLRRAEITDASGGVLGVTDLGALTPRFGPTLSIHRAKLHEALLLGCAGLPLHAGTTLESLVDRGDGVEVRRSDGREGVYDLVVGADGVRSQTRRLVFGPNEPIYAGYTCWRLVVPAPGGLEVVREMWGRGLRFGVVPMAGDTVYCFAVANAPAGTPDPEDGRVERFRARFAGFGGSVPEILEQVERPEQLIHGDLADLEQNPWHRGRVALLGDAAHAVTPNMGQGAAMALESAVVLADLLLEKRPLEETLRAWEGRRRDRVRFVRAQSRRIGRIGQAEGYLTCALRNAALRLLPNGIAARALIRMAEAEI
jgi:2-polyprenyl-6-methoxyphenol hydroxylase-like FAD-dependent oxidoreductase